MALRRNCDQLAESSFHSVLTTQIQTFLSKADRFEFIHFSNRGF